MNETEMAQNYNEQIYFKIIRFYLEGFNKDYSLDYNYNGDDEKQPYIYIECNDIKYIDELIKQLEYFKITYNIGYQLYIVRKLK